MDICDLSQFVGNETSEKEMDQAREEPNEIIGIIHRSEMAEQVRPSLPPSQTLPMKQKLFSFSPRRFPFHCENIYPLRSRGRCNRLSNLWIPVGGILFQWADDPSAEN
ncbi:hypothetical protein TNCV_4420221 [Trichonephila clavipes]|nr:hypothetical protein TNCV_4420221 [Trichonephila clavipes]